MLNQLSIRNKQIPATEPDQKRVDKSYSNLHWYHIHILTKPIIFELFIARVRVRILIFVYRISVLRVQFHLYNAFYVHLVSLKIGELRHNPT